MNKHLEALEKSFAEYLDFSTEPDMLRVIAATMVANRMDANPVWLLIVGSASSGKSEILGSIEGYEYGHVTSVLTKNSLASGLDNSVEPGKRHRKKKVDDACSLLPKLDGKVLIIKDASTVTSMHPNDRTQIFSQLRDAYDGTFGKDSGLGGQRFKSRFGLIMGATQAIEQIRSVDNTLGERFLTFRPHIEIDHDIWEKIEQGYHVGKMKTDLQDAMHTFLRAIGSPEEIIFPREIRELATVLVALRASAIRDTFNKELTMPMEITEMPFRVGKQLATLYTGLLHTTGDARLSMTIMRRVVRDSIPLLRIRLLQSILHGINTVPGLAKRYKFSPTYVQRNIDELESFGIVHRSMKPAFERTNAQGAILSVDQKCRVLFNLIGRF